MGQTLAVLAVVSAYMLCRLAEGRIHLTNYNAMLVGGAEELIPKLMQFYYRLSLLIIPVALLERLITQPSFSPWVQFVGISLIMLGFLLRHWAIHTLGPQWSMRCLCNCGFPVVKEGPYRFLNHPEYVSRALDGAGICLFLGAYFMIAPYLVLNALICLKIIRIERRQLNEMTAIKFEYRRHISALKNEAT